MLSLLLAAAVALQAQAPDPCGARKLASDVETWVVRAPGSARDTLVRTVVCLKHKAGVKVGSYHGELVFDSTSARVVDVQKPQDGMRVENAKVGGKVSFAGADPQGFPEGVMLRVTLRVKTPGKVALELRMLELNSTKGVSLLKPGGSST